VLQRHKRAGSCCRKQSLTRRYLRVPVHVKLMKHRFQAKSARMRYDLNVSLLRQLFKDAVEMTRAHELGASPSTTEVLKRAASSDGFQLLVLQRLREASRKYHIPGANHVLRRVQTAVYGVEVGNNVTLGDGTYFLHTVGVVIGGDAKIGARVKFMGSNTVGTAKENGYPVIEDDVVIGAGARVLGPIRIGKGAVIGANAVVVRDVPEGAVVTGVPGVARVP
jgi:serine O-acetyltransferase